MAMVLGSLVLLLATACCSNAEAELYCMCKDGASQDSLLMAMDFACDAGADCSAIFDQNEACLHRITLKNLCDLAINSYFQITGNCDFNGTATISRTDPSAEATLHGCAFRSPGPVAGREGGHDHWGITAQPPYYHWHGIDQIGPETGVDAPALSRHWCFKTSLICLTVGFLVFILTSISLRLAST